MLVAEHLRQCVFRVTFLGGMESLEQENLIIFHFSLFCKYCLLLKFNKSNNRYGPKYIFRRFRSIAKSYFRRADGILLLYDVTYERSFLNVREWLEAIEVSSNLPKRFSENLPAITRRADT